MGRKLAIFLIVVAVIVAGTITTYVLLPKHYMVAERLTHATVFWHDQEAFVFLNVMSVGRAQNAIQKKLASSRYGWLMGLVGTDFTSQQAIAYHLSASGTVDRPPLPAGSSVFGSWQLVDDNLQLTTFASAYKNLPGFRWDGTKFVKVAPLTPAAAQSSAGRAELDEDDADAEDDERDSLLLDKKQRKAFKTAGWHWKVLTGYEGARSGATLPIALGTSTFNLTVRTASWNKSQPNPDLLMIGASQLELSGEALPAADILWQQNGWHEVSRTDYEQRVAQSGRRAQLPVAVWMWLAIILFAIGWKIWAWVRVISSVATVKSRVLKNLATSYSFPPALPAQFPLLDTAALERYTRDFENMGFKRLMDTSPASDAPNHPAIFCRLLVHTGNHCFCEISQIFQRGKAPMAMKCAIGSHLQDGWSINFSDRKPLPGSALLRRPRSLGINMPEASPAELLQALLTLRHQVCSDLGIAPLTEDTLESYIAKAQLKAKDLRSAVEQKNFLTGVPQFYYRKLALIKTKPEYVWLGDYPKEAEQRKQAYSMAPVS